jgi:dextranase
MPLAEKKTNMKKIIFLMLFAIIGWQQAGAQDFTFGGLNYNVTSSTTVEVGNQNSAVAGNVIIPAQVTYNGDTYPVTSISDSAFLNCIGLTSIIIPNSVASIGNSAFNSCTALTSSIYQTR